MSDEIVNRVDKSPVQTVDLGDYYPEGEITEIDLKDWLYQGLILKEQEFRDKIKEHDWSQYQDKNIALHCSADAIIPVWAWMLMQVSLHPVARQVFFGKKDDVLYALFRENLQARLDPARFDGKPAVIKGCGDKPVPAGAFMEATQMLMPYVKSIMYGEPCSTVPVYKKPAQRKSSAAKTS